MLIWHFSTVPVIGQHPLLQSKIGSFVLNIVTVCTGNICRSPLAEQLLSNRFAELDVNVSSAGTRARAGMPMTSETVALAVARGVNRERALRHRSASLIPSTLSGIDLAIAMSREHRRQIVETQPSLTRTTFTARELARLLDSVGDTDLHSAMATAGSDPRHRLSLALSRIASLRGLVTPLATPEDDDIIDPYGRSRRTYDIAAAQLDSTIAPVERLIRLALGGN